VSVERKVGCEFRSIDNRQTVLGRASPDRTRAPAKLFCAAHVQQQVCADREIGDD
jgi:hypothetical protein